MANIPGNSADPAAGAMLVGDRVNNQFVNVVNYPSTTEWGSDSNFAAMRRRQHHRRYLRSSIVKPSVFPTPQPIPSLPPPPPEPRQIDQSSLRFLFEKQLRKSDVRSIGRIVIPKIETELYMPTLDSREGIFLELTDMDYLCSWVFKFRSMTFQTPECIISSLNSTIYGRLMNCKYWTNNSSRMYLFENTKDFIKERNLDVGDSIMVYKDDQSGKYFIHANKSASQQDLSHTADYTLNQNLPTMNEYGSPLYYGSTSINDSSIPFNGRVQPDNSQLEPPDNFDWLDFINFSG